MNQDRRIALEQTLASCALEGMTPSPEGKALLEAWADGVIDTREMRAAMWALAERRAKKEG